MKAEEDKPASALLSFIFMSANVVGSIGLLFFTLMARRRYGDFFDKHDLRHTLSFPGRFFLETPAPLYAALFMLFMTALLVKEVALERKSVTLRINLAALLALATVAVCWFISIRGPVLRVEQEAP